MKAVEPLEGRRESAKLIIPTMAARKALGRGAGQDRIKVRPISVRLEAHSDRRAKLTVVGKIHGVHSRLLESPCVRHYVVDYKCINVFHVGETQHTGNFSFTNCFTIG